MEKIKKTISNNWIIWIIILQPILDIISYFQSKYLQQSFSWIFRIIILAVVFIVTFNFSKNRKKLILYMMPFAIFFILHIINLYRIGELNIVLDVKYFILVFQMPILTILLIDYVKSREYDLQKIKKSIACNFFIIAMSIFIAYVTNTYEHTYTDRGILGWFSGSNTPSMILCALAPWALYYISNFKNIFLYIFGASVVFIILYINSTTACYLTLITSFAVILFSLIVSKNEARRIGKIIITTLFIIMVIFEYKFSSTFDKIQIAEQVNKENEQEIKNIIEEEENELEEIDFDNIDFNDNKLIADILKTSYLYRDLMEIHGEDKVVEIMKNYLSAEALSNNRLCKVINSKIEFNESDKTTKVLGIGYSRVTKHYIIDMENDLQAIFYYYGYLGMTLYVAFILYFLIKLAIVFFKNFSIIRDKEYIILAFLILLLVAGGEYSGAFLRKPNANIYLSLYLLLLYFKLLEDCKKSINKKKLTFLLLHLGYGGIETSTINTANALSDKYNVELMSFYNLKDNQTKYINKNIDIKYLYNGEPNRFEFKEAVKEKNIIKILREGFKAASILVKKKYLIKKEILKSDSFAIVSTRYDFSKILSEYGRNDVIKIAQEHHHHNNDKKYINILKHKYRNIDYLFALTEGLKSEYEKFLKNNIHTKIVIVPNMIDNNCKEISNLNSKNIISISRLHKGKRLNELIDIFSKIEDKQAKLYIIGDGEEQENLKSQVKELKLEDRVVMTGYLNKEEQKEYLIKSSVYAMTSISEGLPMVLLEAMSFGIPCIAYKTEMGVSDIIENDKNGFVIYNRDENEYIKKLNLLLKDNKLKENMNKNCIKTCEKYSKNEVIRKWEKVLKS